MGITGTQSPGRIGSRNDAALSSNPGRTRQPGSGPAAYREPQDTRQDIKTWLELRRGPGIFPDPCFFIGDMQLTIFDRPMGGRRALVVKKAEQFVFPFPGILHADPLRAPDPRPAVRIKHEIESVSGQVPSVYGTSYLESARELARAGEIGFPSVQGLGRPDEDRLAAAGLANNDIEHLVHPVNEVNVGMARGSEHDLRAFCEAFGRVGRQILGADVGFGFHNARPEFPSANAANKDRPNQAPGQLFRIAPVE